MLIFVVRMPKSIKLLFLILAHFIFVGHNVVAHHHHNPSYSQQDHHHHQYDNGNEHPENNVLEVIYSGLAHTGSHAVYSNTDSNYISHVKKNQNLDVQFTFENWDWKPEKDFVSDSKIYTENSEDYLSKYNSTLYLRGPPNFIV